MGLWSWITGWFRKKEDPPPVSLVMLLREHRHLEAAMLEPIVERVFDVVLTHADDAQDFVVGDADLPTFAIKANERMWLLHHFGRPYFDELDEVLASVRDLRLRYALSEHNAWLSVDALGDEFPENPYPAIGKLIAELLDDNCVAVFAPATNRLAVYDPGMEDVLRGPEPLSIFEEFAKLPIVEVAEDDPEMAAAVAEARRRWPEFVTAFENRTDSQHFAVKAPFTEGEHREYMWLSVTGIENNIIFGKLDNDPGALKNLHCGSTVRVPVAQLNDWIIADDDDMTGGFTIEVLTRRAGQS